MAAGYDISLAGSSSASTSLSSAFESKGGGGGRQYITGGGSIGMDWKTYAIIGAVVAVFLWLKFKK